MGKTLGEEISTVLDCLRGEDSIAELYRSLSDSVMQSLVPRGGKVHRRTFGSRNISPVIKPFAKTE